MNASQISSFTLWGYKHNAQHLSLNNTNIWNNRFHIDLKQIYETYKFVMMMITLNKHKKMNMITMMTLSKHMNMTMTITLNKHMKTNMTRTNKTQFVWMCKEIILKTWEEDWNCVYISCKKSSSQQSGFHCKRFFGLNFMKLKNLDCFFNCIQTPYPHPLYNFTPSFVTFCNKNLTYKNLHNQKNGPK
jgi:hypothetical protein